MKKKLIALGIILITLSLSSCVKNDSTSSSSDIESSETSTKSSTITSTPVKYSEYIYPVIDSEIKNQETNVDLGWDLYNSNASILYTEDGLKISSDVGGFISMWQVIPILETKYSSKFDEQVGLLANIVREDSQYRFPANNDLVDFSLDYYIDDTKLIEDKSLIKLTVKAENKLKVPTIISEGSVSEYNDSSWNSLETKSKENSGKIPNDSVLLVLAFQVDVPAGGEIIIKNAKASTKTYFDGTVTLPDEVDKQTYTEFLSAGTYKDFSDNSFEVSNTNFSVNGQLSRLSDDFSIYGTNSLKVNNREVSEGILDISDSGILNQTLSAGAYVYLDDINEISAAKIVLLGLIDGKYETLSTASTSVNNSWVYLKTPFINSLYLEKNITKIKVVLQSVSGTAYFDLVEVGDYQAIHGTPHNFSVIAYQPWFKGSSNYGNWSFDSSQSGGRVYNPDNLVAYEDILIRDIASVVYPSIGAYDSLDLDVLDYHTSLIKAMGFDAIQVNYYGSLPSAAYQLLVFDSLVKIAEEKDLKISLLYEPKVHLNGWVAHSTRKESIKAIANDLIDFINKYKDSKALLRFDSKIMIEAFGYNNLTSTEWLEVEDLIKENTNESIVLMGDGIVSRSYTALDMVFNWNLYQNNLATDTSENLGYDYTIEINDKTSEFAKTYAYGKTAIGIVYPGFDDTPVRNWNEGNIRKIPNTGLDFYQNSWDGFLSVKDDFDYLLVATFNDFTEGSVIEPTLNNGVSLAYETALGIAEYKNRTAVSYSDLEDILNLYLESRKIEYK